MRTAAKAATKRKGGKGGRGRTGRTTGGGASQHLRQTAKTTPRIAVRPGTHKPKGKKAARSFQPGASLSRKPAGMGAEQWADYIAASDGKIRWTDYFRKWRAGP